MLTSEQLIKFAKRDYRKARRAYEYSYGKLNCTLTEKQDLINNIEYRRLQLRLIEAYVRVMDRKKEQVQEDEELRSGTKETS